MPRHDARNQADRDRDREEQVFPEGLQLPVKDVAVAQQLRGERLGRDGPGARLLLAGGARQK